MISIGLKNRDKSKRLIGIGFFLIFSLLILQTFTKSFNSLLASGEIVLYEENNEHTEDHSSEKKTDETKTHLAWEENNLFIASSFSGMEAFLHLESRVSPHYLLVTSPPPERS